MKSIYEQNAEDFAKKWNLKMSVKHMGGKCPNWDKERIHEKYHIILSRNGKAMSVDFFASIARPTEPSMYDILACLTKYNVGSLVDFADEFGYDLVEERASVEKTWRACVREYEGLLRLAGNDEQEFMNEIQEIY